MLTAFRLLCAALPLPLPLPYSFWPPLIILAPHSALFCLASICLALFLTALVSYPRLCYPVFELSTYDTCICAESAVRNAVDVDALQCVSLQAFATVSAAYKGVLWS